MAEIFRNRSELDAYGRTFEKCGPGKDDVTVSKGFLYSVYLSANKDLYEATHSLMNIVTSCSYLQLRYLIISVVEGVKKFRKFPKECPRVVQFLKSTSNIPQPQTSSITAEHTATKAADQVGSVSPSPPSRQLHTDCSKCDHRRKVLEKAVAEKKLLKMQLTYEKKKNMLNASNAGRFAAYRLRHEILVRQMRIDKERLKRKNKSLDKKVSKLTDVSQIKMLKNELKRTKHTLRECRRRTQRVKHDAVERIRSVEQEHQVTVETLLKNVCDLEAERVFLKDEIAELKLDRHNSVVMTSTE